MNKTLAPVPAFFSMRRHFRCKREEIVAYQSKHLCHIIRHAYRTVPYYRRLFDRHGLRPEAIRGVADLPRIPLTGKQDLKSWPLKDILSRNANPEKMLAFCTSGSTGESFTIRRTPLEQLILRALYLRAMKTMGLRFNDSIANILLVSGPHTAESHRPPLSWRALHLADPRRRAKIDALLPIGRIRSRLRLFKPDVIIGYSNLLARVAEGLTREDRERIRPRFVKADSEVMTPLMRDQISQGFGAPVFEMYDSHEFFMLAWECAHTGKLHVCDDGAIVEVLKDGRPCAKGERGEVVATSLHSYAMPFIRYRLGDIVTKGEETCPCGLPFSTIESVQGRMMDFFFLPDGRMIHPYKISGVVLEMGAGWLRQYQLTQERRDRVIISLVPSSAPPAGRLVQMEAGIRSILGPDVELQSLLVPEIDIDSSGKFRLSRSLVNSPYDDIRWDLN